MVVVTIKMIVVAFVRILCLGLGLWKKWRPVHNINCWKAPYLSLNHIASLGPSLDYINVNQLVDLGLLNKTKASLRTVGNLPSSCGGPLMPWMRPESLAELNIIIRVGGNPNDTVTRRGLAILWESMLLLVAKEWCSFFALGCKNASGSSQVLICGQLEYSWGCNWNCE